MNFMPPKYAFDWSADAIETLRVMHKNGNTFAEIAAAIGTTEVSAKKKAHRLKLPKRTGCFSANRRWNHVPKQVNHPVSLVIKRRHYVKSPQYCAAVEAPGSRSVSLMERTGCCYITTDAKPHLYCNMPIEAGEYCAFHYRRMYV